jgi:hypothetical protein
LQFLCFRKATQEIFSELDETKGEVPIFPTRDGVQSRDRGGPGARRTIGWRGPAHGRATRWCGPLAHCNIPRFYQILGENIFAFVLLEMFENSQGFKKLLSLFENFIRKLF